MALTAAQVAALKTKWQYFTVQMVAFPAIPWMQINLESFFGAITWQPFCLISPRFAFTTGADVTLSGTDSYLRGVGGVTSVVFSKVSGTGTVTDNGNKTATVSGASGLVKVQAVATEGAVTSTSYAYVYGDTAGPLTYAVSRIDGFSGSLATGEWQADITLRTIDYGSLDILLDGRDQPILMHVNHYWNGAENTFGGYVRHNNTFVLICRDSTIRVLDSGRYETTMHVETPAFALKQTYLAGGELTFSETGGNGLLTTDDLNATDPAYFILREATNLHQYFNVSLWDNASTTDYIKVAANTSIWQAAQDAHTANFGILYFDRWSNLNGKPDVRIRTNDWDALNDEVYDTTNPLTTGHMLEYELYRRRVDNVGRVLFQARTPEKTIINAGGTFGGDSLGVSVEITDLVVSSALELGNWVSQYEAWNNTEYEITMKLPMGHELNPGDLFYTAQIDPPEGDPVPINTGWVVDDINYEFDFVRGFWVRRVHAVKLSVAEG